MKAVRFSRFGGPEVLEIVNLPDPHPGPGRHPLRGAVVGGYTRGGDAEPGSRCESDTVLATVTRELEPTSPLGQ